MDDFLKKDVASVKHHKVRRQRVTKTAAKHKPGSARKNRIKNPTPYLLGLVLRHQMRKYSLSMVDVAKDLGWDNLRIITIMNGKKPPSANELELLEKYFELPSGKLFNDWEVSLIAEKLLSREEIEYIDFVTAIDSMDNRTLKEPKSFVKAEEQQRMKIILDRLSGKGSSEYKYPDEVKVSCSVRLPVYMRRMLLKECERQNTTLAHMVSQAVIDHYQMEAQPYRRKERV